ncbi:MAG: FkbM family methyltransferase [Ignavibacteriales bacterium]|nr:FkbM family methyltransferase [Ignavibacteriales bacterium]
MNILRFIKFGMKFVLPPDIFLRILVWKRGYPEPELRLIPYLCDKSKVSIDVGASEGLYTTHMCLHSKRCIAFEPRVNAAKDLERLLSGLNPPIQIETTALSNRAGIANLKVFPAEVGRSTIEHENHIEKYGNIDSVTVPVKRLDDFEFTEAIGCIKIDVEGHEESVLLGAHLLLSSNHPIILIEMEERHKLGTIKKVISLLQQYGYNGFFYENEHLEKIEFFENNIHQNISNVEKKGKYINNFIFFTNESRNRIQHLLR